jgi:hypothetical protein
MQGRDLVNRSARVLAVVIALGLGVPSAGALAQQVAPDSGYMSSYRVSNYFIAPGWYGMSYGFASYGMPQTYSVFSAFPGPSSGSNFPPYGLLPGRFGVGLWRPGYLSAGYVYGASYYPSSDFSYRTFPVTYGATPTAGPMVPPPPVGVYAPALGPASLYGW